ncbi:MAG: peptidase domain-containing ABC transporter [Bacteroidales bacterium]|jgi:ATP-binding cassette subfamily B protein|nr:peptidase domain-containing ABC transporter [Bacteroidales bacterium]
MCGLIFNKQLDSMDCGPACLSMIAKHYGKEYSIDSLRKSCHISKEGVSLLGISEAAEQIGFKTIGGRITFDKLEKEAPLPCIVHWNQEHFVIVYKIKQKNIFRKQTKVYISDPARAHINYTEEEFKKHWISTKSGGEDKGIVLLLEPTQEFYKQAGDKINRNSLKFLFSYFMRYKRFLGQLTIGLLLGSLFQLIFPFLTQAIVDFGIANKNIHFIYLILLAQMVLIISRMSVEFIRRWILLHISTRINISLISDFFIKLMKLPMSYFDTKLTGDILQRIDDHARVEQFLTARTLNTIFSLFTLVIFSMVLWIYDIKIFTIFVVGSIIYALWILIFLKKRRELDFKYFEVRAKNQNKTYQLIQGMQEIKLQNSEKRHRWEWEDVQADLFHINIASLKLQQTQEAGNIFINESKNIIITVVAALAVINNEMTLGMMLATQYIIGQLTMPIEQTVDFIHDLQDTKISLERINEIHKKEDENAGRPIQRKNLQNTAIKIENLVFQYEGPHSKKVLNNINLTINPGEVTAIVGASGSGKTTLIKLLLQFYNPIEGKVWVGAQDLKDFNSTWWRNQCGAVMQDGFIFSESIAHNIATSEDEIDKEKLAYAAKTANIHNFIMELPLKYNTVIGNEGQNLSQGQKQRILIARAVYKNPDFLFFDEATNALDANNEKAIVENLQEFYRGKTVVIVAHRLSTVKNADQIVVLDDGKIVEIGNHWELTDKRGAYYNLVKNQLELGN